MSQPVSNSGSSGFGTIKINRKKAGKSGVLSTGTFHVTCRDEDGNVRWKKDVPNATLESGVTHLLNAAFQATPATPISAWFVGLLQSAIDFNDPNYDLVDGISNQSAEFTNYTEGVRQAWTNTTVTYVGSGTNQASLPSDAGNLATYSVDTGGGTVTGLFIIDASGQGTTGTVQYATADLGSQTVNQGDTLEVGYTARVTAS